MPSAKGALNALHHRAVFRRRVAAISRCLAGIIPTGGSVLDLGAGDGSMAAALMALRPDLAVEGVDVLIRPRTAIPVTLYDGHRLPFAERSLDYVTIIDVLHHVDDPAALLAEAARVARRGVVVKDHVLHGPGSGAVLRLMDWIGNRGHDVYLPYNYLTSARWSAAVAAGGLAEAARVERLGLYPPPLSWVFERDLHFVALFEPI